MVQEQDEKGAEKFVFSCANQCGSLVSFRCLLVVYSGGKSLHWFCGLSRVHVLCFLMDLGALGQSSTSGGTCHGRKPRA